MFRHKPPNHYTHPPPWDQQHLLCYVADGMVNCHLSIERRTFIFSITDNREDTWTHAPALTAETCKGTREGGGTSTVALDLSSSSLLHCYLFCYFSVTCFLLFWGGGGQKPYSKIFITVSFYLLEVYFPFYTFCVLLFFVVFLSWRFM